MIVQPVVEPMEHYTALILILVVVGGTIINVLSARSQAAVAWEQSPSVFCFTAIIAMDNVPSVDNH